jgi:iron-sulfur cluster assembly 1
VPDSSIAKPVEVEVEGREILPRVNETRPPNELEVERRNGRDEAIEAGTVSLPEREAQVSRPEFTYPTSGAGAATEEPVPRKRQESISFEPPRTAAHTATTTSTATPTTEPAPPKRSRLRTPRKAALRLTPTAVSQLASLLSQPDPKLIRVGVRNRGCSGLAYHLEYVDKPGAFDETVEQDGVRVLIDSKALFSIIGSEMDWVEDRLSERFVFRNPNISEYPDDG